MFKKSKEVLFVLMYFYGGGWILGNDFIYDCFVRELVVGGNVVVVFVNYMLMLEVVYL